MRTFKKVLQLHLRDLPVEAVHSHYTTRLICSSVSTITNTIEWHEH